MEGRGVYYYANGRIGVYEFNNGHEEGVQIIYHARGSTYVGQK